jgi:multimeric flavodoxin WrbA
MKALVISGSRNPEGRTAMLINAMCEGIKEGGGTTEVIYLPKMDISHCRQCNNDGWAFAGMKTNVLFRMTFPPLLQK